MAFLFPSYIREIPLSELERNYGRLKISALILTDWFTDRKQLTLDELANAFTLSYNEWLLTKKTKVSYDLVVDVTRESIREISGYLRQSLAQKPVFDNAMSVIGRFDIYKSLLEDSGIKEKEAKLYVADVTSYILVNQLLFYQIISEKMGYSQLPEVNPMNPPKDFLDILDMTFKDAREKYPHILGFDLFPILRKDYRLFYAVARMVSKLKAIRPQSIREELFGRLYHSTIPPETRKNMGAFYTKPEAAKLLAILAINKANAKVIDPACGSGTLLVEAYQRKVRLSKSSDRNQMHKQFLEDIYGIDVMHFAAHMTSMNLTAQDISLPLKPHVYSQDGIKTLVQSVTTIKNKSKKSKSKTVDQPLTRWLETMTQEKIPHDFDVVIMNPPFTRRERIPAKKEDLEKLVPEVKGKTGYWAYFISPSDRILKQDGTLAIVIPEEFFVGRAAQSVRDYIFQNGYSIKYILRNAAEVAFSESAHYRDYLIVLTKGSTNQTMVLTIIKKKLEELRSNIDSLASSIIDFEATGAKKTELEEATLIKIENPSKFISSHLNNLKPLVGFSSPKAFVISIELLERLEANPTLDDLIKHKKVAIKVYNPGQYATKGVETFARKLFLSKYGKPSEKTAFLIEEKDAKKIFIKLRNTKATFEIPVSSCIPSLRTYSKVRHMDISNEEEAAIIDVDAIPEAILRLAGLIPKNDTLKAANDISQAFEKISGNMLLSRKIRLNSKDLYWTAVISDKKLLGTTSAWLMMDVKDKTIAKSLVLYLNSTIALLQLLSFMAEVEGAWVTFHARQIWSNIYIPTIEKMREKNHQAAALFAKIGRKNVTSWMTRLKTHDAIQRSIDEFALELLGFEDGKEQLDNLYDSLAQELEAMFKLSRKKSKSKLRNGNIVSTNITEWSHD
jgi:type I restriction-modification system DNA methylase subunit